MSMSNNLMPDNFVKSLLIIAISICNIANVFGQKSEPDSIHFTGVIYDAQNLSTISEVHITSKTTKSTSDSEGKFSFWANTEDSINFSHLAYNNITWIVSDTIKNHDMLIGIFMFTDTISISEVVIYPRLQSLESLMTQQLPQDKNIRNAKNNLNIVGYQARNTRETTWDAEMNQRHTLQKAQTKTEYSGLISPDDMVPITAIIPLAMAFIKEKYNSKNKEKLEITSKEESVIINLFIRKKMEHEMEHEME